MWRIRLRLAYLWRVRPRITWMPPISRHVQWRLCQVKYDPEKRARLKAAVQPKPWSCHDVCEVKCTKPRSCQQEVNGICMAAAWSCRYATRSIPIGDSAK